VYTRVVVSVGVISEEDALAVSFAWSHCHSDRGNLPGVRSVHQPLQGVYVAVCGAVGVNSVD